MRIVSAASAFPKNNFSQKEISTALVDFWGERLENPELLDRLHSRCGVDRRNMVLPLAEYKNIKTWGEANNLWIKFATELGQMAIERAMAPHGISAKDLNAIYFTTVTGVASPSIDARLVNVMGLSPNIKRVPIFGLGCVAGAAGIARAADYVRAFPDQIAVVLSVELCSLTWRRDDLTLANLISAGLFADGAAAAIVAGSETRFKGPEIISTKSVFYPGTEELMGWDISENGFRIVLSPDVPKVIRDNFRNDVDTFLADHKLSRKDIESWIIHSGGPRVLQAVEESLELPERALEVSWNSLRTVGNLSSASVLVVLEEILANRRCAAGKYSVLAAMERDSAQN